MRWRYGDTNPVIAAVDGTTAIEIGDLIYLNGDVAEPASAQADQGNTTANQQLFASQFLGVAMQRSRPGDTDPIRVATTGVFEFDCAGNTFELGNLMGVDENPGGNGLLDQQVAKVVAAQYAMGRVAKRETVSTVSVLVDIRSTVMTGGVLVAGAVQGG
jgi:hypothetical protein